MHVHCHVKANSMPPTLHNHLHPTPDNPQVKHQQAKGRAFVPRRCQLEPDHVGLCRADFSRPGGLKSALQPPYDGPTTALNGSVPF